MAAAQLQLGLCLLLAVVKPALSFSSRKPIIAAPRLNINQGNGGQGELELDAATTQEQYDAIERMQRQWFIYSESRNLVVCALGKCGTTSLFEYIWEHEFQQKWPFPPVYGQPDVHNVSQYPWEGRYWPIESYAKQKPAMDKAFSFTLIRDPMERLVSSWKSKLACNETLYNTDKGRPIFVKELLRTHGSYSNQECLYLDDFVTVLHDIHKMGLEDRLNSHFVPQRLGCFSNFGPEQWSAVVPSGELHAFEKVAKLFDSKDIDQPVKHASSATVAVSPRSAATLIKLTAPDYALLNPYLTKPSKIVWAGADV